MLPIDGQEDPMARAKTPNTHLAALIDDTGISNAGLARRVIDLAQVRGLATPRYNHASVARWLAGEQPRGIVPDLIAEILSGLAGRRLTRPDVGMTEAGRSDTSLEYPANLEQAVETAANLYGADVHRRNILARSAFTAAAYLVPALRWMTAPAADLLEGRGTLHVGSGEVQAIRELTATFRRLDNQLGGGYARTTVVQYLADEVGPMLRHGTYLAATGRELFTAASEMTLLAGWMAYDLEQHPIAQRYLIQALRLAQAAGDHLLGGEILAAMAAQAAYLGDGSGVVDLARAAARSARRVGSGALLSEALATEAHGHAQSGDARACAALLAGAHQALDTSHDEPDLLAYYGPAYLSARTGRALFVSGDAAGAARALRASLAMQSGYERGRVLNLAMLAAVLTCGGELDAACATAAQAASQARPVKSARVESELRIVAGHLAPHAATPVVARTLRALPPARSGVRALPAGR
jgi:hypothetical protein